MTGYRTASALDAHALSLQTALGATPHGLVENPQLFSGFALRPDVLAAGLLAVADVAGTRYADFRRAHELANLDPVVTASGDRLRFESMSVCNGVYARFDLLPQGIGSGEVGFGTTNVDVNQPLRSALCGVGRADPLHMSVGTTQLRVSTPAATHVEDRVPLPDRWVRGLAETQMLSHAMRPVTEIVGAAIARFVGSFTRAGLPGPDVHLRRSGRTLRAQPRPGSADLTLPGSGRLAGAARLVRFATRLQVHRGDTGSTGWVFFVPGGRFTLLLSPGAYRGFSGEGSLLSLLAHPSAELFGRELTPVLAWSPDIDADELSRHVPLGPDEIRAALGWLAASGRVGHDLVERSWFHRELPVDADAVLRRNPRLVAAHSLVAAGSVSAVAQGWRVTGEHGSVYEVRRAGASARCTCPWEVEHGGSRGPCKHILAALITEG